MPEKSPDSGLAGVEITPEMIKAGVGALRHSGLREADETELYLNSVVVDVYCAMRRLFPTEN